jgi:hypothetical protein
MLTYVNIIKKMVKKDMKNINNVLKIKQYFVVLILLLSAFSIVAVGGDEINNNIIVQYSFGTPLVDNVVFDDSSYNRILMQGASCGGDIGYPSLPQKEASILLPPNSKLINVEVIPGEKIYLGSGFCVEPVSEPIPILESSIEKITIRNEDIYNSENIYPIDLFNIIGTYNFRGYEILVLSLNPIQYVPATGELFFFKELTVNVKTAENDIVNPMYRGTISDINEVIKKVDNPDIIDKNDAPISTTAENYDMLIITTNELKSGFEPLKAAHDAQGIKTIIKTLSDIRLIPSKVTPEDIRDYIKDFYRNYGIEYVLIGGDADVVPAKQLWVQAWNGGDSTFMPSDLYYACLDGTYNYDDDDYWGESKDGDDGKDVDLIAEVYVGRACAGSIEEVNNFVNKTLEYLGSGGYSSGKVLMVGEYLWSNPDTWGDDYMDELIDGSSANMYTTVGIPSDVYEIDKLYDHDWPEDGWPTSELINRTNNGVLIINHLGHASYGYCLKMINDDVFYLVNPEPLFVYSQGCMAGGFDDPDEYDCIAEYFTVKTEDAAFASIMNARYGWGVVGGTDGASQRYHREFWDAVFGENIPQIGKANQDSKEDNIYRINQAVMRWCFYQLNLFGDPALAFLVTENNPPAIPEKPKGSSSGKIDIEYSFNSSTTDLDGDKIYYKWDFDDGTFSKWLGPFNSGDVMNITHVWSKKGVYNIKVKARDVHRAESPWSDYITFKISRSKAYNFFFAGALFERFPLLKHLLNFI